MRRPTGPRLRAIGRRLRGVDPLAAIGGAFAVLAGWVVATQLLNPAVRSASYGPDVTSHWSPLLVLVLLVAVPLVGVRLLRRPAGTRTRRLALPVVLGALLLVKLALGAALLKIPPFDAGSVFLAAYGDAVPGAADFRLDRGFSEYYFGIYPNNLLLTWVLSGLFRLVALTGVTGFANYAAAAVVLNCVVLTITELLTFRVVDRTWGRRAAWGALVAVAVFTTLSPWINTPYSDTLGSAFPIGILALWGGLRSAHGRRALLPRAALLGAVVAVGVSVKPTVVFALVAVVAADAVRHRRALRRRAVLRGVAAVTALAAVTGVGVGLAAEALVDASTITDFDVWANPQGFPLTHFMAMGATGQGGFDGEDVARTFATPPDERAAASLHLYLHRVRELGPEGYALFLGEKALRTFGDGSFGQGAEGDPFPQHAVDDPLSVAVRERFERGGVHHVTLASLWQAGWLLLLAACALPVRRFLGPERRRSLDDGRVAMVLLVAFLLLFETRARYLYLYVPVVVVLATGGVAGLPALVDRLRSRPLLPPRRGALPFRG